MNETVKDLLKKVEERGGMVHMPPDLPDEVAELFLREVLDCRDCLEEARKAGQRKRAARKRPAGH